MVRPFTSHLEPWVISKRLSCGVCPGAAAMVTTVALSPDILTSPWLPLRRSRVSPPCRLASFRHWPAPATSAKARWRCRRPRQFPRPDRSNRWRRERPKTLGRAPAGRRGFEDGRFVPWLDFHSEDLRSAHRLLSSSNIHHRAQIQMISDIVPENGSVLFVEKQYKGKE